MEYMMKLAVLLLKLLLISCVPTSLSVDKEVYIVHMDEESIPGMFSSQDTWYKAMLSSVSSAVSGEEDTSRSKQHLYTYSNAMHGFSAVLSQAEVQHLRTLPGHIDAYPTSKVELLTTHSPKFLGLNPHSGLWPVSNYGDDVIIGFFDTGVWPENPSFHDRGMGPVPARWKGACETGQKFNSSNCNRKLIGARAFNKAQKHYGLNFTGTDYDSPRDLLGHGSHTSSTAAGARVEGAECFGYAKGNAIGIAPKARIAMYKVVFDFDGKGYDADLLAAMDKAIADGVDIMSLSITVGRLPFYKNAIAIGAFAAMEKGILVSCSAGNSGPHPYTLINEAPWITTVGAGTMDRAFTASITLGDQDTAPTIQGKSIYGESMFISNVQLYYGGDSYNKSKCKRNSLHRKEVKGKVVLCSLDPTELVEDRMKAVGKSSALAAIITSDDPFTLSIYDFKTPAVIINSKDERLLMQYLERKLKAHTVSITFQQTMMGTTMGMGMAPQVAKFSSRGPSKLSHGILKPDIIGPGVDILAAWARGPQSSLVEIRGNPLISDYLLLSGTSMSAPHIAGVAALLKSAHPDWSPSAIRSAIMTTASLKDNIRGLIKDQLTGLPATPLDIGAGHVDPNQALDPGLVYDAGVQDYLNFVCGLGYNSSQIKIVTRKSNHQCKPGLDLNYPSFLVPSEHNSSYTTRNFRRIVTSVTDGPSTYHAKLTVPHGMIVVVSPQTLVFEGKNSIKEFTINITVIDRSGGVRYGFLTWEEVGGRHKVRSPIVFAAAPS